MKKQYHKKKVLQIELQNELEKKNNENYDSLGIYPKVERLIAIGRPSWRSESYTYSIKISRRNIKRYLFPYNVQNIQWTGGSTSKSN